jgi:hypothetical protein
VGLLSTLNYWDTTIQEPTIYRTINRFAKQANVERKIHSGRKCALLSSEARAALKKQTARRT